MSCRCAKNTNNHTSIPKLLLFPKNNLKCINTITLRGDVDDHYISRGERETLPLHWGVTLTTIISRGVKGKHCHYIEGWRWRPLYLEGWKGNIAITLRGDVDNHYISRDERWTMPLHWGVTLTIIISRGVKGKHCHYIEGWRWRPLYLKGWKGNIAITLRGDVDNHYISRGERETLPLNKEPNSHYLINVSVCSIALRTMSLPLYTRLHCMTKCNLSMDCFFFPLKTSKKNFLPLNKTFFLRHLVKFTHFGLFVGIMKSWVAIVLCV